MMNFPTLAFVYLGISDMESACSIYAGTPLNKLEIIANNYTPISYEYKYGREFEHIYSNQILYDDHEFMNDDSKNNFINTYNQLVNKYGQQFMDIVITKDNDKVIENIINAINFMFDKVYSKYNTIEIVFSNVAGTKNEKTNYHKLIYSALQQNFIIKSQRENKTNYFITIEKRGNNNDSSSKGS